MMGDWNALREATADNARIVVPQAPARYFYLKPKADREVRSPEGARLHTLLTTDLRASLPGFPSVIADLHHADVLVGTADGQFWFGVDVKTTRSQARRKAWRGMAINVDVILGQVGEPDVAPPGSDGRPTVVLYGGDTAFEHVHEAGEVIDRLHHQPWKPHVPGSRPVDMLLRELTPLRDHPLQNTVGLLEELAGGGIAKATDEEVAVYGNGQPGWFGSLVSQPPRPTRPTSTLTASSS